MSRRRYATRGAPDAFMEQHLSAPASEECVIWPYARSGAGYAVFGKPRPPVNSVLVSRVVCHHTHGPAPTPQHEAAHNCGRGHEGCINRDHIVWKTSKENKADQLVHGTRNFGTRNGGSKLTETDVRGIRYLLLIGGKQGVIAEAFGVNQAVVSRIKHGKLWGHV